jgi:hypothetical protein
VEQLGYLYNLTTAADQRLGRDVGERYEELRRMVVEARVELEGAGP